jgi:hypothetical protein
MSESLLKALPDLGRRVERLLYFGSLLVLLCFLELYFVSAAMYVGAENPEDISELIAVVDKDLPRLERLFNKKPITAPTAAETARQASVAAMRKRLGLPPEEKAIEDKEESYADALRRLILQLPRSGYKLSDGTRKLVQDPTVSPKQIIDGLLKQRQQLLGQPATIWGIQTPLILPMQYGGAQYQVPAAFIANALIFALIPLVIGWLVSLHMTREKELLIMRGLPDYRYTFPHVLNIFPADFDFNVRASGSKEKSRKQVVSDMLAAKIVSGVLRTIIISIFAVPMIAILAYCYLNLFASLNTFSWTAMIVGCVVFAWLSIHTIALVVQEWVLLWNKEFFIS